MASQRQLVWQWAEQGRISQDNLETALQSAEVRPSAGQWQRFLDHLLLWLGTLLVTVGVIFFFAFNWEDLGRFGKFGLVEALILAAVAAYWKLGSDRIAGQAALLGAAILIGGLLALFGQTYQTGADPWQLFANWALLILPLALVGRLPALWVLCLMLVNLTIVLYYQTFRSLPWFFFQPNSTLFVLFAFNTLAQAVWELAAQRRPWLHARWAARLLATVAGSTLTWLVIEEILDERLLGTYLLVYLAWLAAFYGIYRHLLPDLFMLAGICLSLIVTITLLVGRELFEHGDAGVALLIALLVIGMSAAAAAWLKNVAREQHS